MKKVYGYIYLITCGVTSKFYVGKATDVIRRWNEHIDNALNGKKKNSRLYNAIRKYGIDNFSIETIDQAYSLKELNEKERYWISFTNATDRDVGYNIAEGGDGGDITSKFKWYNDGVKNYYVFIDYIDSIGENLVPGRIGINIDNRNTVWINKGTEQKHIIKLIADELVEKQGWSYGMLYRGDGWKSHVGKYERTDEIRVKSGEKVHEWYSSHEGFRNDGMFKPGKEPKNKNKISITNGIKNKFIDPEDLHLWELDGWRRGNIQHHKTRDKELNND